MREWLWGVALGVGALIALESCATVAHGPPPVADHAYLMHQVHYQTGEDQSYRSTWVVAPDGALARTPEVPIDQWCRVFSPAGVPDGAADNPNLLPAVGDPVALAQRHGLLDRLQRGCAP